MYNYCAVALVSDLCAMLTRVTYAMNYIIIYYKIHIVHAYFNFKNMTGRLVGSKNTLERPFSHARGTLAMICKKYN